MQNFCGSKRGFKRHKFSRILTPDSEGPSYYNTGHQLLIQQQQNTFKNMAQFLITHKKNQVSYFIFLGQAAILKLTYGFQLRGVT